MVDSAVNRGLVDIINDRIDEVVIGPTGVVRLWTGEVRLAVRRPGEMA